MASFNLDSYQLGFIMKFLLLLAFAAVAVAVPYGQITSIKNLFQGKYDERIISGESATLGQFPWQVAINYHTSSGSYFCGGSLISNEWVLTAGHCVEGASRFRLRLGLVDIYDPNSFPVYTNEQIVHPGFSYLHNDIALIKLNRPIQLTENIKTIKLPNRGQVIGAGEHVTVSGWGKTSDESNSGSDTLNFVTITTITNTECADVYGQSNIISSTVCCKGAPEHGPCSGDSGGPLVTYDGNDEATLVGVASFVHRSGCATGKPSGFARTESFLDWIHENTGIPV